MEALLADPELSYATERCIPLIMHEMFSTVSGPETGEIGRPGAGEILKYLKIMWNSSVRRRADSELLETAGEGLTPMVEYLVKTGRPHPQSLTGALIFATQGGHISTMKKLIEFGADPAHRAVLNAAIEHNNYETLDTILSALGNTLPYSANVNTTVEWLGSTYTYEPVVVVAARTHNLDMMKRLVDAKADVKGFDVTNVIRSYVGANINDPIVVYLKTLGVPIQAEDLFYNAAAEGDVDAMKRLVEPIGAVAPIGGLVLTADLCSEATSVAVQTLQLGVLQYLKSVGCESPAYWHIPTHSLYAAIGDVDAVRKYLAGSEVKLNVIRAMLGVASREGHVDVVELLIPFLTPTAAMHLDHELEVAIKRDHPSVVKLLLDAYAQRGKHSLSSAECEALKAAVMNAATNGYAEILHTLLSYPIISKCILPTREKNARDEKKTDTFLDEVLNNTLDEMMYGLRKTEIRIPSETYPTSRDFIVTLSVLLLAGANPYVLSVTPDETGGLTRLLKMAQSPEWLDQYVENELARMQKRRKPIVKQSMT